MVSPSKRTHPQSAPAERRTREVSRYAFPYYDLETAIEVARVLHDRAGGKASMVQLASYLGHKDEFSGAFRAKVWGAKSFGLVNIESNNVSVTPLGEQLSSTRTGIQRDRRLAEAFLNVPLFREVYRRYENSTLPSSREGLKKALQETFGVPSRVLSFALKSLEASAEQAGFKRQDPNRLIHPVPIGLIEADASLEPTPEQKGDLAIRVAQGEGARTTEEVPGTVHPAIVGFLQELPPREQRWTEGERQRWLDAFTAMIRALYPNRDEE